MDDLSHFEADDGCRIAYRDLGSRDAPTIMFCTMAMASMSVWSPVAEPLSATHRIILHDRRGNGDSDPGAPETHRFDVFMRDALGVMNTLGIERAVVCGMAFGARVALRIALDAPTRVGGLILFDATGGPPAPESVRRAGSQLAAKLRSAAGIPTPVRDPLWFMRRDPAGYGLNGHALQGQPEWIAGLNTIRSPTVIACGEQDPNFEGSCRIAREINSSKFEAMPMTGHASILERPDLVLSIISRFPTDSV